MHFAVNETESLIQHYPQFTFTLGRDIIIYIKREQVRAQNGFQQHNLGDPQEFRFGRPCPHKLMFELVTDILPRLMNRE